MSILCVGQWCVDIVTSCSEFPVEDCDVRCSSIEWHLGGNCCNMSRVMSYLGVSDVQYVGSLCPKEDMLAKFAIAELQNAGVGTDLCPVIPDCSAPSTVAILNAKTGSRTLLHARGDLPEMSLDNFRAIPLENVNWIHFQCTSNVTEVLDMMRSVKEKRLPLTVSLEIEKIRSGSENLIPFADYIFISKDYAKFRNCDDKEEAVKKFSQIIPKKATVVCAWGSEGAAACTGSGEIYSSPAYSPEQVIDTLGAGDTFNGSLIAAISVGADLEVALQFACRVAGQKCGHRGFKSTSEFKDSLDFLRTSDDSSCASEDA